MKPDSLSTSASSARRTELAAPARAQALLSSEDPRRAVRAVDARDLYGLIHESGDDLADELMLLASPTQIRDCVDFDCWTRDSLETDRLARWFSAAVQLDDPDFSTWLHRSDEESIVLWLRANSRVLDWRDEEEAIQTTDDPFITTPDGRFAVIFAEETDAVGIARLLIARLYDDDVPNAQRILESVRQELDSPLMEEAFRKREGRLGDRGFVPYHEALEVYAFLDPVPWAERSRARALRANAEIIDLSRHDLVPLELPADPSSGERGEESPLSRAYHALPQSIGGETGSRVQRSFGIQFRALVHRVHVADHGAPGAVEAERESARRASRYLTIGLDLVSRGDPEAAVRAIASIPLRDLHRAGYSATLRLQRQAKQILDRGNMTITDAPDSLLLRGESDLVAGLLARHPVVSRERDTPFRSMDDVEQAAWRLASIAFAELLLFSMLRHTRDELASLVFDSTRNRSPVEFVTHRSLFATHLLGRLAERSDDLRPLSPADVARGLARSRESGSLVGGLREAGRAFIEERRPASARVDSHATAYAAGVASWLADELGDVAGEPERSVLASLVLLAP